MKYILIVLLAFFFHSNIVGQIVNADGAGIIYNEEWTVDLRFHTNGWGLAYNRGKLVTFDLTNFWSFEIGEIKHPKQDKRTFDFLSLGSNVVNRSFVYGKQNNLYFLKYSIGQKRYFTEKAQRKGVAFGLSYSAGPVLGLVKPYYLDIFFNDNSNSGVFNRVIIPTKYDGTNGDLFLEPSSVNGATGFSEGLNEIKVQPGIQGKAALHFDWGAFDRFVKGLELGIMMDFYFKEVPIMIIENNKNFYLNLYINAHFGKRK